MAAIKQFIYMVTLAYFWDPEGLCMPAFCLWRLFYFQGVSWGLVSVLESLGKIPRNHLSARLAGSLGDAEARKGWPAPMS